MVRLAHLTTKSDGQRAQAGRHVGSPLSIGDVLVCQPKHFAEGTKGHSGKGASERQEHGVFERCWNELHLPLNIELEGS